MMCLFILSSLQFVEQLSVISRLKNDYFVELLAYCLEANNRILVYQYATMGSLHDVLHGNSKSFSQSNILNNIGSLMCIFWKTKFISK